MLNVHNRKYGYNILPTNPNSKTFTFTKETIDRIRTKNTGKKRTEETKLRMSIARTGDKLSKEAIEKRQKTRFLNAISRGFFASEHTKKQMSISRTGQKRSQEFRNRMSETNGFKIKCIEDNIIFNSLLKASEFYNIPATSFIRYLKNGKLVKKINKNFILINGKEKK